MSLILPKRLYGITAGLVVSSLESDLPEQQTTLWCWILGATASFREVTWDGRWMVPLGFLFWKVLVGDVTTSEMDVSFWCLMCLSILGFLVCTQGPESSFDYSIASCPLVLCGLLIWPLQWQTSSSLWIHWLSLVWRGLGLAQSPYGEFIQCLVETEVAVSRSGHGCCAGTLRWVEGRTSHPVVR